MCFVKTFFFLTVAIKQKTSYEIQMDRPIMHILTK